RFSRDWSSDVCSSDLMSASLTHRGPDASGEFVDDVVSLGHRRLAVVDLSPKGIQPMKFKHLVLVFNGEIFNYQIIKKQLQKKGHRFVSDTDTEVILHAYHQWGANCVKKFIGQWAFVIYDQQKRQLFLSRDRFGILPLYYAVQANQFIFASEIKAILNHKLFLSLNLEGFNSYWFQKYVRTDLTIYQQICQVPPGFNIHYNLHTNKLKLSRYYHLAREIEAESSFSVSQL